MTARMESGISVDMVVEDVGEDDSEMFTTDKRSRLNPVRPGRCEESFPDPWRGIAAALHNDALYTLDVPQTIEQIYQIRLSALGRLSGLGLIEANT